MGEWGVGRCMLVTDSWACKHKDPLLLPTVPCTVEGRVVERRGEERRGGIGEERVNTVNIPGHLIDWALIHKHPAGNVMDTSTQYRHTAAMPAALHAIPCQTIL